MLGATDTEAHPSPGRTVVRHARQLFSDADQVLCGSALRAANGCCQDADGELVGSEVCWLIEHLWETLESPLQMSQAELAHEATAAS